MNKEEFKNQFMNMQEQEQMDFYNTVVCCFGSSDDMIYLNNAQFWLHQFLSDEDVKQAKANPQSKYRAKDRFIRMLEYKQVETSNSFTELAEVDILAGLVLENLEEVRTMGFKVFPKSERV